MPTNKKPVKPSSKVKTAKAKSAPKKNAMGITSEDRKVQRTIRRKENTFKNLWS